MKLKENKGITLIALVITIIVLLILAGVTISTLTGDNGILTQANKAKDKYSTAGIIEEIETNVLSYLIDKDIENGKTLQEVLRENLDESQIGEITSNGKVAIIEYKGLKVKINLDDYSVVEDTPFDVWDGTSTSEGLVGKGTEEEPYLIRSASDLYYFGQQVGEETTITGLEDDGITTNGCNEDAQYSNYKLTTNIALNDVTNYSNWSDEDFNKTTLNTWIPIGRGNVTTSYGKIFCGSFDGNGYEITGMYINNENGYVMGLFGYIGTSNNGESAIISNVRITNMYIVGKNNVGGIAGNTTGGVRIENCYSSGYIKAATSLYAGGIIGELYGGKILNCTNNAEVRGNCYVGGIVGNSSSVYNSYTKITENVTMENCTNTGDIYGHQDIGGIAGAFGSSSILCSMNNCYNTGTIRSDGTGSYYMGGVIGRGYNTNMTKCYNTGNLTELVEDKWNYIGGVIGWAQASINTEIVDCYNTGNIDGNVGYVGGILGESYMTNQEITITLKNCYSTGKITSNKDNVGDLVGKERENLIIQ